MIGDDAANAVIAWLSIDAFDSILFLRSNSPNNYTDGKMTLKGAVCGADRIAEPEAGGQQLVRLPCVDRRCRDSWTL